jgi:hypothetical protein
MQSTGERGYTNFSVNMTSSGSALIRSGRLLQPMPRLTNSGPVPGSSNRPREWDRDKRSARRNDRRAVGEGDLAPMGVAGESDIKLGSSQE